MKTKFGKTAPSSFNRALLGFCVAGLLGVASTASAQAVVNFETPAADSYVGNADWNNGNHGSEEIFQVSRPNHNSSNRRGYIRFDLGDLLTNPVSDATLTLNYVGRSGSGGTESVVTIYGLNPDFAPGEGILGHDWDEMALENSNAPWAAGNNSAPSYVTALGTFVIPLEETVPAGTEFSISTPELSAFLESIRVSSQENVTFIITSSTNRVFEFATKENELYAGPSLSVTVIPESSATFIMGFAAGGAIIVSRLLGRKKQ